jgi:photosystem II stability/assembly factor-like uncharacterized protein
MRAGIIVASVAITACVASAPPAPVVAVANVGRVTEVVEPARVRRGVCAIDPEIAFVPPADARTIATPERSGQVALPTNRSPGTWYGNHGGARAALDAVWASGSDVFAVGGATLLRSRDGGGSFDEGPSPVTARAVWGTGSSDVFLAGGRTIAHSSDDGASWRVSEPLAEDAVVAALAGDGADLYAVGGKTGGGLLLAHSSDHGATWAEESLGDIESGWLYAVAIRSGPSRHGPHQVFVGGHARGSHGDAIFARSSDCGATWARLATPPDESAGAKIGGICWVDDRMIVATTYAVWSSTDGGASWNHLTELGAEVLGFACEGEDVWVGGRNRSFLHSRDGGAHWTRDELAGVFTGKALSSLQGIFASPRGEVFVVGEGIYSKPGGSIFVRTP